VEKKLTLNKKTLKNLKLKLQQVAPTVLDPSNGSSC
jgi:predicted secreted hydrolase